MSSDLPWVFDESNQTGDDQPRSTQPTPGQPDDVRQIAAELSAAFAPATTRQSMYAFEIVTERGRLVLRFDGTWTFDPQ